MQKSPAATESSYAPKSVQEMWDNHYAAFGGKDIEKVMLDYDENSVITNGNQTTDELAVFKGMEEVRRFFGRMFQELSDVSDLAVPLMTLDEAARMIVITWRCPASGFIDGTDTFLIDGKTLKIHRQNVVFKKSG